MVIFFSFFFSFFFLNFILFLEAKDKNPLKGGVKLRKNGQDMNIWFWSSEQALSPIGKREKKKKKKGFGLHRKLL